MSEIIGRNRKVDVDKLTDDQAEEVGEILGKRIRTICDKAVTDVNMLTSIYGIKARVVIQLLDEKTENLIETIGIEDHG